MIGFTGGTARPRHCYRRGYKAAQADDVAASAPVAASLVAAETPEPAGVAGILHCADRGNLYGAALHVSRDLSSFEQVEHGARDGTESRRRIEHDALGDRVGLQDFHVRPPVSGSSSYHRGGIRLCIEVFGDRDRVAKSEGF